MCYHIKLSKEFKTSIDVTAFDTAYGYAKGMALNVGGFSALLRLPLLSKDTGTVLVKLHTKQ